MLNNMQLTIMHGKITQKELLMFYHEFVPHGGDVSTWSVHLRLSTHLRISGCIMGQDTTLQVQPLIATKRK